MARRKLAQAAPRDLTLDEAVERYIVDHHEYRGSTAATIRDYRAKLSLYRKFLRQRGYPLTIQEIAEEHVRAWVADMRRRGLSSASIQGYVAAVKAITRWLARNPARSPLLPADPLGDLAKPQREEKAKPTIARSDIKRVLASRDHDRISGIRDTAMTLLLLTSGMRRSELLQLRVEDVDLAAKTAHIRLGKGGKFRVVPVGPPAIRALREYLDARERLRFDDQALFLTQHGTPLSADGCKSIFRRVEAQTGIRCNPHAWRHTAAIEYLRNGGRQEHLQAMLGHTTSEMTSRYARITQADLLAEHRTADPAQGLRVA